MKSVLLSGCLLAFVAVAAADESQKVPKLIRGLKAAKANDRVLAADQLARLGPDAKPALKALVGLMETDKDAGVRAHAVYAIKQIGDDAKSWLPQVIEVLKKDTSAEVRLRRRGSPRGSVRQEVLVVLPSPRTKRARTPQRRRERWVRRQSQPLTTWPRLCNILQSARRRLKCWA